MPSDAIDAKALRSLAERMCRDLQDAFSRFDPEGVRILGGELLAARRIACFGVGREGLMMQAGCMRLMHTGLASFFVGEMAAPPVGKGDLFFASAGPGHFPTVEALVRVAREAGARTVVVTARPAEAARLGADLLIPLEAQTMATVNEGLSVMPMGSHYEAALLLLFDLLTVSLLERTGQPREAMYTRYTNLK